MKTNHQPKVNWPFLLIWVGYPVAIWTLLILLILSIASCAPQKATTECYIRTASADTLALQARQDTHLQQSVDRLDSFLVALKQSVTQQHTTDSHATETTTEVITTTIDSLGRELRTEQRTTQRTESQRQQLLLQQQIEQQSQFIMRVHHRADSLLSLIETRLHGHWETADSAAKTTMPAAAASASIPWYRRLWQYAQMLAIGAVLGIALYVTRRWWIKLLKR